ncbi:MAG: ABC transporter permease [Chloroflexota bacterium]
MNAVPASSVEGLRRRLGPPRPLRLRGLLEPALWAVLSVLLVVPAGAFLVLAVSPAAFDQGQAWLTLSPFAAALRGPTLRGLLDSLAVGVASAALALLLGLVLAWLIHRTTLPAKGLWVMLVWALLLMPSYLSVLGWESLVERRGVLAQVGLQSALPRHLMVGPVGVVWILTTKGLPFAYLALAAGLLGLGREFEDAARVHGASSWAALRIALPILSPAMWSAVAVVFAESISDFGVSSTLAAGARFPIATYTLFLAIDSNPIRFPVASAVAWFLVASTALALAIQHRALKGRSFAVLGGRTRPCVLLPFGRRGQVLAVTGVAAFFAVALCVPLMGAVSASLLKDFGSRLTWTSLTLSNYQRALTTHELLSPLLLSLKMAAIAATLAVLLGGSLSRILSRRGEGVSGRALDLLLLAAIALPGIVLAAGYIFAYNLPAVSDNVGLKLYGTLTLLGMAYLAGALPGTARLLVGPMAQIQSSLLEAARVHGNGEIQSWMGAVLPLLARALLWAWLLTFAGVFFELPISQLLYPPGQTPLAVAVTKHLENYDFAGGSAMMMIAAVGLLAVIGLVLAASKLLVGTGWQAVKAR